MPKFNAAFWQWFQDSKIVDAKGNPLVVYHGTAKKFTKFENKGGFVTVLFSTLAVKRSGFFFSENEDFARQFITERTGWILPCYLSIQNPANFVDNPDFEGLMDELEEAGIRRRWLMTGEMWEKFDDDDGLEFIKKLKAIGYDGAIIEESNHETRENERVYVAFNPNQIKSAIKNDGTYDLEDESILSNPRWRRR